MGRCARALPTTDEDDVPAPFDLPIILAPRPLALPIFGIWAEADASSRQSSTILTKDAMLSKCLALRRGQIYSRE